MSEITQDVLDAAGKQVRTLVLSPEIFGVSCEPSLVQMVVRWQLARRRAGTHSTQTRSMKASTDKKMYKQKGTGRARAGSPNSPTRVGGAVCHGPHPRKYGFSVMKRVRRDALKTVLSDRVSRKRLFLLDELKIESGRTKDMRTLLKSLGAWKHKSLVVVPGSGVDVSGLQRAARNLPDVTLVPVEGLNVYDVLRNEFIISSIAGIEHLQQALTKKGAGGEQQ
jgi:large subunit ribosomal protein L4